MQKVPFSVTQYYFMVARSSTLNFCVHKSHEHRMPQKKKMMGTGAVVSVLSKFVHPPKEIMDKDPVRAPTHIDLRDVLVLREAVLV